jgi:rRNA-processing protein FCF1
LANTISLLSLIMASEKGGSPRFFVASKIRNMVKNISPMAPKSKLSERASESREHDTIHSFHITESQQKPFLDCDALFTDCEEFLKLSNRVIEANNSNKGKSGLSKFVAAMPSSDKVKWRSKKKGNDLHETYENIQTRVDQMDSTLNEIADVSATSTSALITQSVHLNNRLTSCIDYNRTEVDKNKPLVTEGRAYLNKLKSTEKAIVAMIDFLEEVNELKRTEPKPYIPWALRQQYEDEAEAERKAALSRNEMVELKRDSLERRLKKIRKVRNQRGKLSAESRV